MAAAMAVAADTAITCSLRQGRLGFYVTDGCVAVKLLLGYGFFREISSAVWANSVQAFSL